MGTISTYNCSKEDLENYAKCGSSMMLTQLARDGGYFK